MIPPISISVSGNSCLCCGGKPPRGEDPPAHYMVVWSERKKLIAISPSTFKEFKAKSKPERVFEEMRTYISHKYGVDPLDLPEPIRPLPTRRASVADIRALELSVKSYLEGKKESRDSNSTNHIDHSPTMPPAPHSEDWASQTQ